MGKIVMPKNSALLEEVHSVLKIYYNAKDWVENDVYKVQLKEIIGDDQYSSSYTKKSQITSYFGFTEWEDINNQHSKRRITDSGIRFYEAIVENDVTKIQDEIMLSLENMNFGRNNFGCPLSNSDIEPPSLFIRAVLDLGYLTYREFAFLLWQLEDIGCNYTDAIYKVKTNRTNESFVLDDAAIKYSDAKPILILVRWQFLEESDSDNEVVKKIRIKNEVVSRFENRLRNLKVYNIDKDFKIRPIASKSNASSDQIYEEVEVEYTSDEPAKGAKNIICHGNPGCGKSYKVSLTYNEQNFHVERTTFHPEYNNSDFIGQIVPKLIKEKVSYTFEPGVFARILKYALENPIRKSVLIIEEINRGNASAIFGDIFQLLDRNDDGNSIYSVKNPALESYLNQKNIILPSNLWIVATMNTSDQNVFTLDAAFKRRWQMVKVRNTFVLSDEYTRKLAKAFVPGTDTTWQKFVEKINISVSKNIPIGINSEDKQIGIYFVSRDVLCEFPNENDIEKITLFSEKVLMYFWEDVAKIEPTIWFDENIKTLDDLLTEFELDRLAIFKNIDFS